MSQSNPSSADPPAPATPPVHHDDQLETISRNSRNGLILFSVYLLLYGGFMGLSAFAFKSMAAPVFAGVNLAIIYGIGLIIGALVLAAIYMYLCRPPGNGAGNAASKEAGK